MIFNLNNKIFDNHFIFVSPLFRISVICNMFILLCCCVEKMSIRFSNVKDY